MDKGTKTFAFEHIDPSTEVVVNPFEGVAGAGDIFTESVIDSKRKEMSDFDQKSLGWHLERMKRFTGSTIDTLLGAGKANTKLGITAGHPLTIWGKTALNLIREKKVLHTMTDEGREEYALQEMKKDFVPTRWGVDNEPLARKTYCEKTGLSVIETGFTKNTKCEYHGGSFDGNVIEDGKTVGIIEIKCPFNPIRHGLNLDLGIEVANKRLESGDEKWFNVHHDYYGQIQSNIETAGVEWCDFVSFDPRQNEENKIVIIRIYRDEIYCENMMDRIHKAKKILDLALDGMTIEDACIQVEGIKENHSK